MNFHVPKCPQLTVGEVINQIKSIDQITRYLPDLCVKDRSRAYIERGFLFAIINTCDRDFFPNAIAELDSLKSNARNDEVVDQTIEIDSQLIRMLTQLNSRLSPRKALNSKRTMSSLLKSTKKRSSPAKRKSPVALITKIEPKNSAYGLDEANARFAYKGDSKFPLKRMRMDPYKF